MNGLNENKFMKIVQIKARERGLTVFRNNTGLGWVGKTIHITEPMMIKVYPGDKVIREARPLHAGLCEGSSDLIGWENGTGLFTALEVKTPTGAVTSEQHNFIDAVNKNGGIGRIIRSIEDIG